MADIIRASFAGRDRLQRTGTAHCQDVTLAAFQGAEIGPLTLLDPNVARRAAVSHWLAGHGVSSVPYDHADELLRFGREGVPVLAADDGDVIADLVTGMQATGVWMPMIAYSETLELRRVTEAIKRGTGHYLIWPFDADDLLDGLQEAQGLTARVPTAHRDAIIAAGKIARLTPRERQVLELIAKGFTNRQIGKVLHLSNRTVEKYRESSMIKLEVQTSSAAIRCAIQAGLA